MREQQEIETLTSVRGKHRGLAYKFVGDFTIDRSPGVFLEVVWGGGHQARY